MELVASPVVREAKAAGMGGVMEEALVRGLAPEDSEVAVLVAWVTGSAVAMGKGIVVVVESRAMVTPMAVGVEMVEVAEMAKVVTVQARVEAAKVVVRVAEVEMVAATA